MNPEFKKEEIKQFKKLVEIQLGITKVVFEGFNRNNWTS